MEKEKVKMIGLKLDLSTIEKIEFIMLTLKIRSYNQVIRNLMFSENMTLDIYYNQALTKNNEKKVNTI